MSTRRLFQRIGDAALSVGAVLGLLCLMMLLAGGFGGLRPVIVLSGSMSPSMPAGSLAIARPVSAADLRTGDVVTVPAGAKQVTHRIVAVAHHDGSATLRLQGDDNARADEQSYEVRSAPRVVGSVPVAGRVVAWLSRAPGVFVLAGYAALLLTILTGRSGVAGPGDSSGGTSRRAAPRHRTGRWRRPLWGRRVPGSVTHWTGRVCACVVTLGLGVLSAAPAKAAWGDSVPVTGSIVATYTVPRPATFTCGALGVLSVTFNWTAVVGATNYTLHYGTGGSLTKTVTGTTTTVVAAVSGGTAWLQANRNFGSTTWTSVNSAMRTYTVAAVSLCS